MTDNAVPGSDTPQTPPPPPATPPQEPAAQPAKVLYGRATLVSIGVVVALYAGITFWKRLHPNPSPAVPGKAAAVPAGAPADYAAASSSAAVAASTETLTEAEGAPPAHEAPAEDGI